MTDHFHDWEYDSDLDIYKCDCRFTMSGPVYRVLHLEDPYDV